MSLKPEVSSGSGGVLNQNQLISNMTLSFRSRVNLTGFYVYGGAYSSTDGTNTFSANSYDLKHEYGRFGTDVRRHFVLGGDPKTMDRDRSDYEDITPLRFCR
jgi:hypothetical protein